MKRIALLGMFLLVGCGDASFTGASQDTSSKGSPDLGTTLVLPSDAGSDAGDDSAVAVTDDAGDVGDAGQDASSLDWRTCCSEATSAYYLCVRNTGDYPTCATTFDNSLAACGTAPAGQTCTP